MEMIVLTSCIDINWVEALENAVGMAKGEYYFLKCAFFVTEMII
jgi:hypothetical protein